MFACPECHSMHEVEWPDNAADIWDALMQRPLARTRNWFPSGHDLALRANCPHGQTPAELLEEQGEYEAAEA
jgi:hypothetical protein